MQRANASPSFSTPSTPSEPSAKRQRLSNGSFNSSPAVPSPPPSAEAQAYSDAQAREEQIKQAVVEREGLIKGDTKWYLSVQQAPKLAVESPLRIVSAGYAALDEGRGADEDSGEEEGEMQGSGRMNFGNFSRKPVVCMGQETGQDEYLHTSQRVEKAESESSDSDSSASISEDDGDDPTGMKAMIREQQKEAGNRARAERKQQRKSDAAESARLAEARRKKTVDLNRVTSISGSGKPSASASGMECFSCGKKGHKKSECPQQRRKDDRRRQKGGPER